MMLGLCLVTRLPMQLTADYDGSFYKAARFDHEFDIESLTRSKEGT